MSITNEHHCAAAWKQFYCFAVFALYSFAFRFLQFWPYVNQYAVLESQFCVSGGALRC